MHSTPPSRFIPAFPDPGQQRAGFLAAAGIGHFTAGAVRCGEGLLQRGLRLAIALLAQQKVTVEVVGVDAVRVQRQRLFEQRLGLVLVAEADRPAGHP